MRKKLQEKIKRKTWWGRSAFCITMAAVLCLSGVVRTAPVEAEGESCPDVHIIFARGEEASLSGDKNYDTFRTSLEKRLKTTGLKYKFTNLPYKTEGVNQDNFNKLLSSIISGRGTYDSGRAVVDGRYDLGNLMDEERIGRQCKNTKYVWAGYSQGAQVLSYRTGVGTVDDSVLYVATFADPKLYLPEGKGLFPAACRGQNLSDYRAYVPDCRAYEGILKGWTPYAPDYMLGRMGTWCNKHDLACSSHFNLRDHLSYAEDGLYEDASRIIFDKINQAFGLNKRVETQHDTAILIDSTASMRSMISSYKKEALRLAKETLDMGGRIALYDYRDLNDGYDEAVERCNFENCTLEKFQAELNAIRMDDGGDTPESMLAGAWHVMKKLRWQYGATKSLVVLTDAPFLNPDRNGKTLDDVVKLSKEIDPVNFYIITSPGVESSYQKLAERTGGKVVTDLGELSMLTDFILDRYDSLPRVEESSEPAPENLPSLELESVEYTKSKDLGNSEARVKFKTNGTKTLVALNDMILGVTDQTELTITELDGEIENNLRLIPMTDDLKGEAIDVKFNDGEEFWLAMENRSRDTRDAQMAGLSQTNTSPDASGMRSKESNMVIPKAPNTGIARE